MPSSGLLISWAMPAAQAAHRAEALGVEQAPLELAHARFLRRARLEPGAAPRLLHREAAEQNR